MITTGTGTPLCVQMELGVSVLDCPFSNILVLVYIARSSSTHRLNLPPVKSSFGQRPFSFAGPSLCHSLPLAICKAQDFGHFTELCRCFYSNA